MNILARSAIVLALASGCVIGLSPANAADLIFAPDPIAEQDFLLPAVSGVNAKWELNAGLFNPGSTGFRAAGSVSIPLGERFGAQGDVMATLTGSGLYLAAAGHLFTRDPSQYLIGVAGGVVVAPGATLTALGIEGELYMDRWSLEGWAGIARIDYAAILPPDETGFFAIGDIAFYPTDDLRLSVGGSTILGDHSLHLGTEYQLSALDWPVSLTGDARLHANGSYALTVGLKGYLGPTTGGKSLIDRHRQDDPPNRAVDLSSAGAGVVSRQAPPEEEEPDNRTDQEICEEEQRNVGLWEWDDEGCFITNPS